MADLETRLREKLALLRSQRDQLLVNLHQHEGAIAVLEEQLASPKESPAHVDE